ncbi:MAG: type II toxin-antitoxin system HipA family toxin [Proteobacteria bacterium]|nr:type II toxin-antitoxin system HipA family toxin [Pseudomonadota bacterium]
MKATTTKKRTSTSQPSPTPASKHLEVLLNDKHVGVIERTQTGKQRLVYDRDWMANPKAIPVSHSLPLTKKTHDTTTTANFMWGLLPDNGITLDAWGRRYKVSPNNPFGLLAAVGEDCPGAIQLIEPDADLSKREGVKWINEKDLGERVKALRADPGAARSTDDKGRVSLPGAQTKTALYKTGDKWGVPNGRTPTTHILKPEPTALPGLAANEHFTLLLLRELGLPSPNSQVLNCAGIPVFVTQRYDRFVASDGMVRRIHQEDMCQALGLPPSRKYQSDGGPGIPEIMEVLRFSEKPDEDRDRFMRAQALNFVVGNGDAHAKNYSILYAAGGRYRLAPFYDVACLGVFHKNPSPIELAMTIGGERLLKRIQPKHWRKAAQNASYDEDRALAHVRDLLARIPGMTLAVRSICAKEKLKLDVIDTVIDNLWPRIRSLSEIYGVEMMDI